MKNNMDMPKTKIYRVPIVITLIFGAILFLPAGSFKYWPGWIYLAEISFFLLFFSIYFSKKDPALLVRRTQFKEQSTQKGVMQLLSLLAMLSFLIPGLDYRFKWSSMPTWLILLSNVFIVIGFIFIFLVFKENSYASTIIQIEEKQPVISTGPYAVVRHPFYAATLLVLLFTPLALGSYYAITGFLLFIPINVLRIIEEENMLIKNLQGYKDYCLKTQYRMIPFIW